MPGCNLWELAIQQSNEKNGENQDNDSTIVFLGNKKSGKSTLVYRFVERMENPKPTLALEYLYARHSRSEEHAKVCHIWELGGGTLFTPLLETPIKIKYLQHLSVVLVLDLSKPSDLWFTMEILIREVKAQIQQILKSAKDKSVESYLSDNAWKRVGNDHPDHSFIEPFLVPLLIIGSKYDIFQELDPEIRKIVSRTLRFIAHAHGAMLQFISTKAENLISWSRLSLSHLAFGTSSSKNSSLDYNKPIYVPFGGDSLELIGGITKLENYEGKSVERCFDNWKEYLDSICPQIEAKEKIPEDPGTDINFLERDIDLMRAQKHKELEEYRKRQKNRPREFEYM